MATAEQINDLRVMINEPSSCNYTDDELQLLIDSGVSLQSIAGSLWSAKAARYSGLVDVQEGSSRRSLGSLQTNALKMAAHYQGLAGEEPGGADSFRPARTRAITRP